MINFRYFIILFLIILNYSIRKIVKNREIEEKLKKENKEPNPYYSTDLDGKLLFMRHGQTKFNEDKNYTSRRVNPIYSDCKLARTGILQAKSKRKILKSLSFEKIYVSPAYRALQTLTYSLETHPNKENIIAYVHPLAIEISVCVNDFLLDIKQTKKDFNLNSKVKIDWSIFDEYVKNIKYDENFFYFENFDNLEEKEKNDIYIKLKDLYDNYNIEKFKIGLIKLAQISLDKKIYIESLKHRQERFIKFLNFIRKKHKDTLENKNEKIMVFSHGSFMKIGTNLTSYKNKKIKKFFFSCHYILSFINVIIQK